MSVRQVLEICTYDKSFTKRIYVIGIVMKAMISRPVYMINNLNVSILNIADTFTHASDINNLI